MNLDRLEPLARSVHFVHGTRGIIVASGLLLGWLLIEPNVDSRIAPWVVAPLLLLLVLGLATLAREGVAVQLRARELLHHENPVRVLQKRAVLLALLLVLLLPRVFLALYGIPHLSPAAGYLAPQAVQSIAAAHVAAIVLIAALYLRSSGMEAHVPVRRPIELRDGSGQHLARTGLQVALLVTVVASLWALRGFWQPFSLLEWPPGLASLSSVRATASIAVAVAPPALLLCALVGHIEHLWTIVAGRSFRARRSETLWTVALATGVVVCGWLHLRNLLWVERFQQAGVV